MIQGANEDQKTGKRPNAIRKALFYSDSEDEDEDSRLI